MRRGFTIVELLVVIAVIAILATIVIVGYGAVIGNANDGSVKSDLQKIDDAMKQAALDNGGIFPNTASEMQLLNLKLSPGAYNTTNQANIYLCTSLSQTTYAIMAMSTSGNRFVIKSDTGITQYSGNVVWDANDINGDATCASIDSSFDYSGVAGINNGSWSSWTGTQSSYDTVTNIALDPSATSLNNYAASGAAGTTTIQTSGGVAGDTFARRTFSATGTGGIYMGRQSTNTRIFVSASSTYTASGFVRASSNQTINIAIQWYDGSGSLISTSSGPATTVGLNWARLNVTDAAPASAVAASLTFYATSTWGVGDYEDVDATMITAGSTVYDYASGDSAGWAWSGTAGASTSSGPAL
jgi:prepilin-type N-terminal cleavage/methylation domain-containing protein